MTRRTMSVMFIAFVKERRSTFERVPGFACQTLTRGAETMTDPDTRRNISNLDILYKRYLSRFMEPFF